MSAARKSGELTLAEQAYAAIEERIVTLELAPGAFVSEIGLAAELGIGRTPVREALQRLASEQLVEIIPRRGVRVTDVDTATQLQVIELRREIERFILIAAARRSTSAERARFAELAEALEASSDPWDELVYLRSDREFNELAEHAARNSFAMRAIAPLHALSRRFWIVHLRERPELIRHAPALGSAHAKVARAVASADEAATTRAAAEMLDLVTDFIRDTLPA